MVQKLVSSDDAWFSNRLAVLDSIKMNGIGEELHDLYRGINPYRRERVAKRLVRLIR